MRELAWILHGYKSGRNLIGMLAGYIDESISTDEHNLCLGAWLAPAEEWGSLQIQWNKRLGDDGIKVFHAADCEHRIKEFKNFTPEQRTALKTDLIDIILRHQVTGFCSGVIQQQSQQIFNDLNVPKENLTYALAAIPLLEKITNAVAAFGLENEKVALIYEHRQKIPGLFTELFEAAKANLPNGHRLSTIAHGKKTEPEFCMLQTADLLAYEAAKHLYNFHNDAGRGTRIAFLRLKEKVQASYMDTEEQQTLKSWALDSIIS